MSNATAWTLLFLFSVSYTLSTIIHMILAADLEKRKAYCLSMKKTYDQNMIQLVLIRASICLPKRGRMLVDGELEVSDGSTEIGTTDNDFQ